MTKKEIAEQIHVEKHPYAPSSLSINIDGRLYEQSKYTQFVTVSDDRLNFIRLTSDQVTKKDFVDIVYDRENACN